MDNKTIKFLNQLNEDFYKTTAVDFDDSRQYFWQGWDKISPLLDTIIKNLETKNNQKSKIRVADIGCGNGRFGEFLLQKLPQINLSYTGIDGNQTLLGFAEKSLEGKIPALHLQQIDIISSLQNNQDFLRDQKFSLIGSFGVFHHIPSYQLRLQAINYLLSKLEVNGYLIISLWQFMEFERFQKKVVLSSESKNNFEAKEIKIAPNQLEKNDFILDWKRGEQALRYCHFYNQAEQNQLIQDSKASLIKSIRADGKEGNVNQYIILQKTI